MAARNEIDDPPTRERALTDPAPCLGGSCPLVGRDKPESAGGGAVETSRGSAPRYEAMNAEAAWRLAGVAMRRGKRWLFLNGRRVLSATSRTTPSRPHRASPCDGSLPLEWLRGGQRFMVRRSINWAAAPPGAGPPTGQSSKRHDLCSRRARLVWPRAGLGRIRLRNRSTRSDAPEVLGVRDRADRSHPQGGG